MLMKLGLQRIYDVLFEQIDRLGVSSSLGKKCLEVKEGFLIYGPRAWDLDPWGIYNWNQNLGDFSESFCFFIPETESTQTFAMTKGFTNVEVSFYLSGMYPWQCCLCAAVGRRIRVC